MNNVVKNAMGVPVVPFHFKKLRSVKSPDRKHVGDAGIDFYIPEDVTIEHATASNKIGLGIAIEIPFGYFMAIVLRSSTGANTPLRLSNGFGVIDSGYRGEICLLLDNISQYQDILVKRGDRIAQGIILPAQLLDIEEVDTLSSGDRGEGGFGSTGK